MHRWNLKLHTSRRFLENELPVRIGQRMNAAPAIDAPNVSRWMALSSLERALRGYALGRALFERGGRGGGRAGGPGPASEGASCSFLTPAGPHPVTGREGARGLAGRPEGNADREGRGTIWTRNRRRRRPRRLNRPIAHNPGRSTVTDGVSVWHPVRHPRDPLLCPAGHAVEGTPHGGFELPPRSPPVGASAARPLAL